MSEAIRIDGLAEFRRNLKSINSELPKAMRLAANDAAGIVVAEAKPRVPFGPGRGGHAASSIKAASTATAARVKGGGKKFPYYPWLDFGGRVGRKRAVKRPFIKSGRYIWSAFDDKSTDVFERYSEALVNVARQAGVDVDP